MLEFDEIDIKIADKLWPGSKKSLQAVNRARTAAARARRAAGRALKEGLNALAAADNISTVEPALASTAAESLPSPSGVRPTTNVEPFHGASQCFDMARANNPNWWRIPIARGEFLLSQCAMPNRHGETGWNEYVNVDFAEAAGGPERGNSDQPATSDAETIADPRTESMDLAIRLFDTTLQMNPNSPDAYRDRAEAWRLEAHLCTRAHESQTAKSHLAAALESATAACALGNYRQPGSLRTLAEITHDLNLDESAADYAEKAYACCSLEDRPATENLLKRYYALVRPGRGRDRKPDSHDSWQRRRYRECGFRRRVGRGFAGCRAAGITARVYVPVALTARPVRWPATGISEGWLARRAHSAAARVAG